MPPVSLPPSVASGHVCTLSIAILHINLLPADDATDEAVASAEVVLIALVAAEKIDMPEALLDGAADPIDQQSKARANVGESRIVARIVEEQTVAGPE